MKAKNNNIVKSLALGILYINLSSCTGLMETDNTADVLQGVYTIEQAQRGSGIFSEVCRTCHTPRDFRNILSQSDDTLAIINDYYDLIRLTMPQDSPGSLSEDAYLDVMAYLLSLNGIPSADP